MDKAAVLIFIILFSGFREYLELGQVEGRFMVHVKEGSLLLLVFGSKRINTLEGYFVILQQIHKHLIAFCLLGFFGEKTTVGGIPLF